MYCSRQFRDATRKYMCRFDEILDTMAAGMICAQINGSISHNFIVQMIPHHRGAIEMSRNILKYTAFLPLREMAQNIITKQTESIKNMREILSGCEEKTNSPQDICMYQKNFRTITCTMLSQMKNACADNQISANFIREMIPHHMGAIHMSRNALSFPICPQLIPVLQAIISSQEKGIEEMHGLLKCLCE